MGRCTPPCQAGAPKAYPRLLQCWPSGIPIVPKTLGKSTRTRLGIWNMCLAVWLFCRDGLPAGDAAEVCAAFRLASDEIVCEHAGANLRMKAFQFRKFKSGDWLSDECINMVMTLLQVRYPCLVYCHDSGAPESVIRVMIVVFGVICHATPTRCWCGRHTHQSQVCRMTAPDWCLLAISSPGGHAYQRPWNRAAPVKTAGQLERLCAKGMRVGACSLGSLGGRGGTP